MASTTLYRSPSENTAVIATLGWLGVLRLGLVQTALGAIVVLTTSTINRVMVVELALPAILPGLLVGLHYAVQITRPRMGYGSDQGGRRTPWIIGGMAVLAIGGVLAALATAVLQTHYLFGIALAIIGFIMVGLGVGAAGTSLLVLLATSVTPRFRGMAATTVWVMMIVGFIVTAIIAGKNLDPFSFDRLVGVTAIVSFCAFIVTVLAVWGVEKRVSSEMTPKAMQKTQSPPADTDDVATTTNFRTAMKHVWQEPESRRFSVFVFVSMLAYSAQDLILEPFAGTVFGMTPGESTQLSGTQHSGVLLGMLAVALFTSSKYTGPLRSLRFWTVGGCLLSAVALLALAVGGLQGANYPLSANVFALGLANGAFAVAAIGSMMALVGRGARRREGVRMGLFGAAQAIAFGLGGLLATSAVDVSRFLAGADAMAYGIVFVLQGVLFVTAAMLARRVYRPAPAERFHQFDPSQAVLEMER